LDVVVSPTAKNVLTGRHGCGDDHHMTTTTTDNDNDKADNDKAAAALWALADLEAELEAEAECSQVPETDVVVR